MDGNILPDAICSSATLAFDPDVLAAADVVLYDRTLASLIARLLPPGRYAEPITVDGGAEGASPRALQFAADGWRVIQLMKARGALEPAQAVAMPGSGLMADDLVTLVLGPDCAAAAPAELAFTANGLAG